MTQHQDYYVYALLREDNQTPFYIGKGRGKRINVHEKEAFRDNSHKGRIIQNLLKRSLPVIKIKLVESLTDNQAKQIECDLIQLIGRWPLGPLANLTKGGDGVAKLSEDSRAKKSLRNVLSWQDPKVRAARLLGIQKAKIEIGMTYRLAHPKPSRPTKEETSRKKSVAIKANWADQKVRRKRCEASRKFQSEPEYRKKRRVIAKAIWSDPEYKKKTLAAIKAGRKPMSDEQKLASKLRLNSRSSIEKRLATSRDPSVAARRIAAQKAAFSTPEAKAKRSEASKKMWAAKKAQNTLPSANVSPSQPL